MLDTPRTVREVTDHIRDLFDSDPLLGDLWIAGEVLESTVSRSGHVFFTLAGEDARIRCVLFRMNALRQRTLPSPGSACVAHGRVEIYAADGSYQFYVDLVEEAGIGLAALEFELLRQQLEAEGLFSEGRKRPLPAKPRMIGVITSGAGSVWHDIQNVIRRRYPFAQLLLASAAVQGDSAPTELVQALQSLLLDGRAEVIVIARGGGAVSDLAAFNDEALLRAAFASSVPIVSAVGHETDWTLLDLVADLRAPTPSAAAELVTPPIASDLANFIVSLDAHITRFQRSLSALTMDVGRMVDRFESVGPASRLRAERTRFAGLSDALVSFTDDDLVNWSTSRSELLVRLEAATTVVLRNRSDRASHAAALLAALSPAKTMSRGYAFVEHLDSGRPLTAAGQASIGDQLRIRYLDGSVESVVSDLTQSAH